MGIPRLEADYRFVCNRLWGSGKRRAQGFRTYFYKFADAEPATRIALLRMEIVVFMSRNTSGDYAILQQHFRTGHSASLGRFERTQLGKANQNSFRIENR